MAWPHPAEAPETVAGELMAEYVAEVEALEAKHTALTAQVCALESAKAELQGQCNELHAKQVKMRENLDGLHDLCMQMIDFAYAGAADVLTKVENILKGKSA
jgi:cell division protein FtsB